MTATPITVVFACPRCGTIYQAKQHRGPGTHFGVFKCVACKSQVYAWSGLYDFLDWQVGAPAKL
jgi:DNA-directed RNA polymerase subunit RPC12/RpoP